MRNTPREKLMRKIILSICLVFSVSTVALAKSVVVFGLDETGSYELRRQGVVILKGVVQQLQPQDVLYVRRITDQSYVDQKCTVLRLAIPSLPEKPKNNFDMKSRTKWQQAAQSCELLKAKAIKAIDEIQPVKAPKTDIWGFLLAAQERLNQEPDEAQKFILVSSDMKDNVLYKPDLKLNGIRIMVVGFEKQADPVASRKLENQWREQLLKKGAQSVEFFSADMPLHINQ